VKWFSVKLADQFINFMHACGRTVQPLDRFTWWSGEEGKYTARKRTKRKQTEKRK